MLTTETLDSLEAGRTYWIAYRRAGVMNGSGLYEYAGATDPFGARKHEFRDLKDGRPVHLSPGEITSTAGTADSGQDETAQITAANVAELLDDQGFSYSLEFGGSRTSGFYTVDLAVERRPVVGVFLVPPGDETERAAAEFALRAAGLTTLRLAVPPLVAWLEGTSPC